MCVGNAGYEKVAGETNEHNINTGSTNLGAMYLCGLRGSASIVGNAAGEDDADGGEGAGQDDEGGCEDAGSNAAGEIVGLEGGLAVRPCPADTKPVGGTAAAGGEGETFDFDPMGVGVHLCVRRS